MILNIDLKLGGESYEHISINFLNNFRSYRFRLSFNNICILSIHAKDDKGDRQDN